MASDMGLSGCAIGTTNIDQFAKMTGIEFHVDGPVGQFAIGRRTNRGLLTDAPLWPGNVLQAMAKGGVSNSDLKFNPQFPALPRPSAATRVGSTARCDGLEVSDSSATSPVQEREYGALRVRAMDDPGAARHGSRAVENLTAAGLHALRRRLDVADVEVVKPKGDR
jgi:hypothetical protein